MDSKWEENYAENKHYSRYPNDLVISIISRMYPGYIQSMKILDLGCGAGNHMDFFMGTRL